MNKQVLMVLLTVMSSQYLECINGNNSTPAGGEPLKFSTRSFLPTQQQSIQVDVGEVIRIMEEGSLTEVEALLDNGINVNGFWGPQHKTLLHYAIVRGDENIVSALLARNADVNLRSGYIYECTPLYEAILYDKDHLVPLLLAQPEILINLTSGFKTSPLHLTALRGKAAIVKQLLAIPGIQLNHRGPNYLTPLKCAISNDHQDVVWELIKNFKVIVNDTHIAMTTNEEIKALLEIRITRPGDEEEFAKWG
jgi:hypothetical protein